MYSNGLNLEIEKEWRGIDSDLLRFSRLFDSSLFSHAAELLLRASGTRPRSVAEPDFFHFWNCSGALSKLNRWPGIVTKFNLCLNLDKKGPKIDWQKVVFDE